MDGNLGLSAGGFIPIPPRGGYLPASAIAESAGTLMVGSVSRVVKIRK